MTIKNNKAFNFLKIIINFSIIYYIIRNINYIFNYILINNYGFSHPKLLSLINGLFPILYAILQIPSGIIQDIIAPSIIMTFFPIIFGIGIICQMFMKNIFVLIFGRILMGIGSTVACTYVYKYTSIYFPNKMYVYPNLASILGLSLSIILTKMSGFFVIHYKYLYIALGGISILIGIFNRKYAPKTHIVQSFNILKSINHFKTVSKSVFVSSNYPLIIYGLCAFNGFYLINDGYINILANLLKIPISVAPILQGSFLFGCLSFPIFLKFIIPRNLMVILPFFIMSISLITYYHTNLLTLIIFVIILGYSNKLQVVVDVEIINIKKEYAGTILSIINSLIMLSTAFISNLCWPLYYNSKMSKHLTTNQHIVIIKQIFLIIFIFSAISSMCSFFYIMKKKQTIK